VLRVITLSASLAGVAVFRRITAEGLIPYSVRDDSLTALVNSVDREDLLRALRGAIELLLREAGEVQDMASKVEPQLRELTAPWRS